MKAILIDSWEKRVEDVDLLTRQDAYFRQVSALLKAAEFFDDLNHGRTLQVIMDRNALKNPDNFAYIFSPANNVHFGNMIVVGWDRTRQCKSNVSEQTVREIRDTIVFFNRDLTEKFRALTMIQTKDGLGDYRP